MSKLSPAAKAEVEALGLALPRQRKVIDALEVAWRPGMTLVNLQKSGGLVTCQLSKTVTRSFEADVRSDEVTSKIGQRGT